MKYIFDIAEDVPLPSAALCFAIEAIGNHTIDLIYGKGYNPDPASYSNKVYVATVWPKVYEYFVIEVKLWKP